MGAIYCIWDTKAQTILGGVYLHKADAAAVRFFTDILLDKQTIPGQHPDDFELWKLAYFANDDLILTLDTHCVLTGAAWLATQNSQLEIVKDA